MAYFNEPLLKQDLNALAFANGNGIETAKTADNDTKEFIPKDNSNFEIAHLLSIEKTKLIEALAQFPATALWLINKYKETDTSTELEEDLAIEPALSSILIDIKKQFHALSLNASSNGIEKVDKKKSSAGLTGISFFFS